MVGDGMGPSFNTAYRYYKINLALKMNATAFDKYLKGTNRTYPNDPKENVTDSVRAELLSRLVIKHTMAQSALIIIKGIKICFRTS